MPETLVKVTLPEMGESVTEGSIVEWRVKPGQWVDKDATLVDVTTDKVDVEIPAPASGVVTNIAADEGASVDVGGLLAEIDTAAVRPEGAPNGERRCGRRGCAGGLTRAATASAPGARAAAQRGAKERQCRDARAADAVVLRCDRERCVGGCAADQGS